MVVELMVIYSFIYLVIYFHQMIVTCSCIKYNEIQLHNMYGLNECSVVAE